MAGESASTLLPSNVPEGGGGFEQIMGAAGFDEGFIEGASLREPFGTDLGVVALEQLRGTGGPTEPKGGGTYDDYKTQDE